ncbi:MAG TPA: Nif3-like dinuclear metal center hexameric protein [Spirochaetia bacterium]|nr:Nif3-like dinuclear metal center hexameric protein [Spirochaetia bacterium]
MVLQELDRYLRGLLPIAELEPADTSLNGIQVDRSSEPVHRAAFAVDACMESFARAKSLDAQVLVVHHGLFWGKPLSLTGSHYARVKYLLNNDIALYAVHLPLDLHPLYGNNTAMAEALGLEESEPFGVYHGVKIGRMGRLARPATLDELLVRLGMERESCLAVLPFGPPQIQSVGVVSGGGARDVLQAIGAGLDLYITGDAMHEIYHLCLEERINVVCGGHYQTEVWGVRRLASRVAEDLGIETVFIDVPTGL